MRYRVGFETKTLVYETLVRRGVDGGIVPGLASAWRHEDGEKTLVLQLCAGTRFHDDTPVTAAAVAQQLRSWVGLPEHGWPPGSSRVQSVLARSELELEVRMDRPYALLAYLCAVDPGGLRAPGAVDRDGEFVRPLGSGPFRFERALVDGTALRYRGVEDGTPVDLVRAASVDGALAQLRAGKVDAVSGGWQLPLTEDDVAGFRGDPRFEVSEVPGSSVVSLSLALGGSAMGDLELRRAVRDSIDRDELVGRLAGIGADVCRAWAAPTVVVWPRTEGPRERVAPRPIVDRPLVLAAHAGTWRGAPARALVEQLRRRGASTFNSSSTSWISAARPGIRARSTWFSNALGESPKTRSCPWSRGSARPRRAPRGLAADAGGAR